MYEVKRVEAQDLLCELKGFAFRRSPGLRQSDQTGYEENRAFYHNDPLPASLTDRFSREICKSTFGFAIFQVPRVRNKRSFSYTLSAAIERTLPVLEDRHLRLLAPDILEEYGDFTELDEGALSEATAIELQTSDHELREISANQTYTLSYGDDIIYESSDGDVLYGVSGTFTDIAPIESEDNVDRQFVAAPIEHESLPPAENVIANLGFWAIVEPFGSNFDQGISYRSAAQQMRGILHVLETGEVM